MSPKQFIREDSVHIDDSESANSNRVNHLGRLQIVRPNNILRSNIIVENQESSSNNDTFHFCIICSEKKMLELIYEPDCSHIFCLKCGKLFFEDCIENGASMLQCPKFGCLTKFSENFVSKLVSDKLLKKMETNKSICVPDFSMNEFTKQNVLEIAHTDILHKVAKIKEYHCFSCGQRALFGKLNRKYAKGLNCGELICKLCGIQFDAEHFRITSFNYCRPAFRARLIELSPPTEPLRIHLEMLRILLLAIASFLLVPLSLFSKMFYGWPKEIENRFLLAIYFCAIVLLLPVPILVTVLILPYFSLFLAIK